MIEIAGILIGSVKDLAEYLDWKEEEKLVSFQWPEESGFKAEAEAEGYEIRWTRSDLIETRKLEGYVVLYEVDKLRRVKRRIVLQDGLTLMGRKGDECDK
jgi:hypothetical protein